MKTKYQTRYLEIIIALRELKQVKEIVIKGRGDCEIEKKTF